MSQAALGHYEHSKVVASREAAQGPQVPLRIVFLGAGSGFFDRLFVDVLSVGAFGKGSMVLVDNDERRLDLALRMGERINRDMGRAWRLEGHVDFREALGGADYIINCIEVSGLRAVRSDYEIPARYGVKQCIGDTIGPGGIFKALRTAPVLLRVLEQVERVCPDAVVLNYTNPMSILCQAARRYERVRFYGMCHSVQATRSKLAEYLDVPWEQVQFRCGGANHLAWFTELSAGGRDLYPRLFEKSRQDPAVYEQDPIRFDMMHHFGYFVTESSGHFSEYVPYYRKRPDLIAHYCRDGYLGESGFYSTNWPQWRRNKDAAREETLAGEEPVKQGRSWEYASYIMEARAQNQSRIVYATVPNRNLIENVSGGVVEVACAVTGRGLEPIHFGLLPLQCAALCEAHLRACDLAAQACTERSRAAALHALLLDPLTAAVCSPAETRSMFDDLWREQADLLTDYQ